MTTTPTDDTLDDATFQRCLDVADALDDTVRTIRTLQGTLELGHRDLERQAARMRELSPGMLSGKESRK